MLYFELVVVVFANYNVFCFTNGIYCQWPQLRENHQCFIINVFVDDLLETVPRG